MSMWSRLANVFRPARVTDDIDEELRSHIDAAIASGRDPEEARRALGSPIRLREASRDARVSRRLDALRADTIFGWRQLRKHRVASAAGILSLALAIGACTAAFRVMDALLWRPLPIAHAERLHLVSLGGITPEGQYATVDRFAYPAFVAMRDAVEHDATLLALSPTEPVDVAFGSEADLERVDLQYVSASMFANFGIAPALGRVLTPADDDAPGAHPYAVLSNLYWRNRFGGDPRVIGQTFRIGPTPFTIVGVAAAPFVGTEPGVVVDMFVPASMHRGFVRDDWTWLRTLALVRPGVSMEPLRARLDASWHAFERNRAKSFVNVPQSVIEQNLAIAIRLDPAASGASTLRADYALPLAVLGVMVGLVLLIACANLANLLSAQSASRSVEMALRVAMGAGRARLVQLVVVEGVLIAGSAAVLGAVFAAWAAPLVVAAASSADAPAQLIMPFDARVTLFAVALAAGATALFSLRPALGVSTIHPLAAMRGSSARHTRRPVARSLIAAQVAFCVFVLFVTGLSVGTFSRLTHRALGFSTDRVLVLDAAASSPLPLGRWHDLADALGRVPGVERVAFAGWPMLAGRSWNGFVSVEGAPANGPLAEFLNVSPAFFDAMGMPLVSGRPFNATDTQPGQAIVSEAFVRQYLEGRSPIGRRFAKGDDHYEIVGVVRDAIYSDIHLPAPPIAFVPFRSVDGPAGPQQIGAAAVLVRVAGDRPAALAASLRAATREAGPQFRLRSIRTQASIVDAQLVRERLLALLAAFFGSVALALTGVGLYGMLHFAVLQRQREIGIRRAIGARAGHIAGAFAGDLAITVGVGVAAGLAAGYAGGRFLSALFYGVEPTDAAMLAGPVALVTLAALAAGLAPIARALRINPVAILRAE